MAITVSSTTETQEALQKAADYGLKTATPAPEVETEEHAPAEKAESGANRNQRKTRKSNQNPKKRKRRRKANQRPSDPWGRPRKKLLRRLSRLHSENLTLQERLEAAEAKLKGGERPPAETGPAAKPQPKDYKDYEQYVEALADWKLQQREQERAQAAQNEYIKSIFDDYNSQVEKARETYEDFDEVVGTAAQVPMVAINAMYEMDNGAEVAYFLGQHADVRAELLEWNQPGFKGGVRKILSKLDAISEQLGPTKTSSKSNGSSGKQRPATSAPAPIRPVGSASSTRSTASPGEMSYADYKKWYARKYPDSR